MNLTCESHLSRVWEFNECLRDDGVAGFGRSIGSIMARFLNGAQCPLTVFVVVMVWPFISMPHCSVDARGRIKVQLLRLLLLLFRLGVTVSLVSFLGLIVGQERPCLCDGVLFVPAQLDAVDIFNCVSLETALATVIAFAVASSGSQIGQGRAIATRVGVLLLGVLITSLAVVGSVLSGSSSIGQAVSGVALGCFVHAWSLFTPLFVRLVDLLAVVVGSIVAISLAVNGTATGGGGTTPNLPPTDTVSFVLEACLSGVLFQLFAVLTAFVWFDFSFLRRMLLRSEYSLHEIDVLMAPLSLQDAIFSSEFDETEEFLMKEGESSTGAALLLFCGFLLMASLWAINVLKQTFTSFLRP